MYPCSKSSPVRNGGTRRLGHTVETLNEVSKAAMEPQQTYFRKVKARNRLLEYWPENWRECFPHLTFPPTGMEAEKFLQVLSTVAQLQPEPQEITDLLHNAIDKRHKRLGTVRDNMVRLDEITQLKNTLQEAVSDFNINGSSVC